MCALAKKCAGKPMVSCLMGDSTALASAIVRCCPKCSSAVRVCRIVSPVSSDNFANEVTNCPRLIFVPFTHPIFQFARKMQWINSAFVGTSLYHSHSVILRSNFTNPLWLAGIPSLPIVLSAHGREPRGSIFRSLRARRT